MLFRSKTFTFVATFLTLVFLIYLTENKVDALRKEMKNDNDTIASYQNEIEILEAEWSYQNNPERLAELMFRVNWTETMDTPKSNQFTELHNLPENSLYFSKITGSRDLR